MMKKAIVSISLALLSLGAFAQKGYEPMDSWPYEYAEFRDGTIRTTAGALMENVPVNICLVNASLHYVQGENLMQSDMQKVFTARIGDQVYVNIGTKMHKILWESEKGAVVELSSIDMDQLNKADIGYGISSATASHQKTSLDLMGGSLGSWGDIGLSGKSYSNAYELRDSGTLLPVKKELFLLVQGVRINADKRSVINCPGVNPDEAKAFFKANKIKWNKVESLSKVAEFIFDQKNTPVTK